MIRGLLAVALVGLVALVEPAMAADDGDGGGPVAFTCHPFGSFAIGHPEATRFGALQWVGGFEIEADRRAVGGLSGLFVRDGGRSLLSQSDDGYLMSARIRREGDLPRCLENGIIGRMSVEGLGRLGAKRNSDTESIDLLPGDGPARLAVSFEGEPQVMIGTLDTQGQVGPLSPTRLPPDVRRLRDTKGLESLAALPPGSGLDGTMIILAERAEYKATVDDQPGWVIGGTAPLRFRVHRTEDFDLTDAKVGPDGKLYVLERMFSIGEGVRARIRRFTLSDIKPGAVIDGEVLFQADLADQIDNMEGLAIWRSEAGETRLSLISDNNRSFLQRSLYLEFKLVGP